MRSRILPILLASAWSLLACSGKTTEANKGSTDDIVSYCTHATCPAEADSVTTVCTDCPVSNPDCVKNLFGQTKSYASSCGGTTVEVHFGFDVTKWNFDGSGDLIGVAWSSDTSSESHGEQCEPTGQARDWCVMTK